MIESLEYIEFNMVCITKNNFFATAYDKKRSS